MATTDRYQNRDQVRSLLERYFDLGSWEVEAVIADWLQRFDLSWIHSAVVEALYQGRYKLVSVNQILRLWSRRGSPVRHYSREFESMISGQPLLFSGSPAEADSELVEQSREALKAAPEPSLGELLTGSAEAGSAAENTPEFLLSQPVLPDLSPELRAASANDFKGGPSHSLNQDFSSGPAPNEAEPQLPPLDRQHRAFPAEGAIAPKSSSEVSLPAIEPFRPLVEAHQQEALQKTEGWLGSPVDITTGHPEPIQTFVPQINPTGFEQRLQAVARRPDRKP